MAITTQDVQHIAALSRLALTPDRTNAVVHELNTILGHMDALAKVDTDGVQEAIGIGAQGLPVRSDAGDAIPLVRALDAFAPVLRDGLLLVPRLSTHETAEEA